MLPTSSSMCFTLTISCVSPRTICVASGGMLIFEFVGHVHQLNPIIERRTLECFQSSPTHFSGIRLSILTVVYQPTLPARASRTKISTLADFRGKLDFSLATFAWKEKITYHSQLSIFILLQIFVNLLVVRACFPVVGIGLTQAPPPVIRMHSVVSLRVQGHRLNVLDTCKWNKQHFYYKYTECSSRRKS